MNQRGRGLWVRLMVSIDGTDKQMLSTPAMPRYMQASSSQARHQQDKPYQAIVQILKGISAGLITSLVHLSQPNLPT